jgi:hypothetical protein
MIPRKKLIEVALPLEAINRESTLHHSPRRPFQREPDFGVTSVNYASQELLTRAEEPA